MGQSSSTSAIQKLEVLTPNIKDQTPTPAMKPLVKTPPAANIKSKAAKLNDLEPDSKLRATFVQLFHEIQFSATKNALMNYHEAEKLEDKGTYSKFAANTLTALSASGVLAGVAQSGKVLANKFGLAGLIGLPVCGVAQFMVDSTSSLVPSYSERAKMHATAAAGWMSVAETARMERQRIQVDPKCEVGQMVETHRILIEKKETASKMVLIPKETHRLFNENPEEVYLAMKKRNLAYAEFLQLEKKHKNSDADLDEVVDLYF